MVRSMTLAAAVAAVSFTAASVGSGQGPDASPALGPSPGLGSASHGTYAWPVEGPVLRGFDAPASAYGAGHRGIDIGAPYGTAVGAAESGRVAFAGRVAGSLFVSIDHPDGVRSTYSWLSDVSVRRGDSVLRGKPIGRTGAGDPSSESPHLHFGTKVGDVYVDPLLLLEPRSLVGLVHLAPLREGLSP